MPADCRAPQLPLERNFLLGGRFKGSFIYCKVYLLALWPNNSFSSAMASGVSLFLSVMIVATLVYLAVLIKITNLGEAQFLMQSN